MPQILFGLIQPNTQVPSPIRSAMNAPLEIASLKGTMHDSCLYRPVVYPIPGGEDSRTLRVIRRDIEMDGTELSFQANLGDTLTAVCIDATHLVGVPLENFQHNKYYLDLVQNIRHYCQHARNHDQPAPLYLFSLRNMLPNTMWQALQAVVTAEMQQPGTPEVVFANATITDFFQLIAQKHNASHPLRVGPGHLERPNQRLAESDRVLSQVSRLPRVVRNLALSYLGEEDSSYETMVSAPRVRQDLEAEAPSSAQSRNFGGRMLNKMKQFKLPGFK